MISGVRVVYDEADLDKAAADIIAASPKVSPEAAKRVARIVLESVGMEPREQVPTLGRKTT
jgi:hypothetical protein